VRILRSARLFYQPSSEATNSTAASDIWSNGSQNKSS